MMKTTNVQHNVCVRPLFTAEPAMNNFQFEAFLDELTALYQVIVDRVGKVKSLILYPHRVFRHSAWNIKIIGEKTATYLLLNIAGRYQGISDLQLPRLTLSVIDDIDAFWLCHYLAARFDVQPSIPAFFPYGSGE